MACAPAGRTREAASTVPAARTDLRFISHAPPFAAPAPPLPEGERAGVRGSVTLTRLASLATLSPPGRGKKSRRGQLLQHIRQDAAVAQPLGLAPRVDARDQRHR